MTKTLVTGTCWFVSRKHAARYYEFAGGMSAVVTKLRENEIKIGRPALREGERLVLLDGGTRWGVETPC